MGLKVSKCDSSPSNIKRIASKKILVLGSHESGKSTLIKQAHIIFNGGLVAKDDDASFYRSITQGNVLESMLSTLYEMDSMEIALASQSNEIYRERLLKSKFYESCDNDDIIDCVQKIWFDTGVQEFLKWRADLSDTLTYFFNSLDRINRADFCPKNVDVLRAKIKTTGIYEHTFDIKEQQYTIVDVGGTRSERKKWFHTFEGVQRILFCVALSDYDQNLSEDGKTNRMKDSLQLFHTLCNDLFLKDVPISVVFTKTDLFERKIPSSPLQAHFPEYKGRNTKEDTCEFIQMLFHQQYANRNDKLHCHFINALDSSNAQGLFDKLLDNTW